MRASPRSVAWLFLKLGVIGFGGPAAHVALMRREIVERRKWVSDERFGELFGAANLIPGPSSTELGILLGYETAGLTGLLVAGACFILPATAIVGALAWAYVSYGTLPQARWLLYGVTPVIIAVVADAILGMGRASLRGLPWVALAVLAACAYALGVPVLLDLVAGGLIALVAVRPPETTLSVLPVLFATFLKIGAVAYGGGYVLLAFLREDFVVRLGWLTERQLVDAVSVGQVTPGPVFTTATFIGWLIGGAGGAALATLGIFLPSFVFAFVVYRALPRIRRSVRATAFLRGATAASIGLMSAVTVQLARAAIVDAFTAALAVAAFVVLRKFRVESVWLVAAGAVIGLALNAGL